MIDTTFRLILLLLAFSFKFSFAQLTTFTEAALERPFEYPNNTLLVNPPNSSTDFIITIDTNNIFNQILPSHFGLNFPHFIGDNVLEEENFLTHTSNLSSMYYRIPGGSGSDRYFWDGNIPNTIREDAQIGVDDLLDATDYRIGPNEYMNVIEDLNSNAIVVVNAGYARYGIAENNVQVAAGYAADFVRHLNITLGKNIKYWEVGNELYGSWEAGHEVDGNIITGSEYGDIFNVFVDSMKAVDPNIKIGAVCYPIDEAYNYWTRGVLQKVENTADFLIIHDYFKRKPNPNNVSYQEMLHSVVEVQQDVNNMRNMVSDYTSKDENYFPIAMTEFNSKTGEREIAMANALFIANVLAEQIKHGIQMSLLWNLENGLGQDGGDHGVLARNSPEADQHTPRPNYYAYYLMQKYFGDKMIFSYSPDTTVISYSTMFANDGLGFMLINTSSESKTVGLSSNYYKSDYYWHELHADNEVDKKVYINGQTSDNSEGGPLDYLDIASYYRPYENDSRFELKPYSITFIANIGDVFPIYGCTDSLACNFDPIASYDDNSCVYSQSIYYLFLYNKQGWIGAGGCSFDYNNVENSALMIVSGNTPTIRSPQALELDASEFGSVTVTIKNMSSVSNGFKLQYLQGANSLLGEVIIPVSSNMSEYEDITVSLESLTDLGTIDRLGFKGPFQAESGDSIFFKSIVLNKYFDCGECNVDLDNDGVCDNAETLGCTASEAVNYNADATEDDGSCEYPVVDNPCDITPSGLFVDNIIHERVAFNWSAPSSAPSYYMIRYRAVGTSSWTVMSAGPQNDVPFTGTTRTRYFMEPGTTYQWNIRARVVDENGATVCQSPWSASHQYTTLPACANLTDLSVNSEANLVYFNANKPSGEWGIWQAKGKIREVGSNNYRYLATTEDNYTNQIKYNFTPSTDYEWHTKAWCTGNVDEDGNSDPQYHSGWGEFSAFTTQDPCDKLPTNLSTTSGNNANTAITMSWDTPISGQPHHYFLELTNETTGQVFSWNNLAGSSTSKTKYGQSSGDQFKWRIRGACGENGTSWATPFTGYEYYTLGGDRLGNDSQSNSQLTNISVYPNPSRGEFNISFNLESRQDVYLSITNYLGEVIFTEELKNQEGQYNKTIDLGNKANGIYMLNITTNNQNINQKIIIQ